MAGRIIGVNVSVVDPQEGTLAFWYHPGDREEDIPEKHLAQLTNPKIWHRPIIGTSNVTFESTPIDYWALTVPRLLELCEQRNIQPESMKKADVVGALVEYDATAPTS